MDNADIKLWLSRGKSIQRQIDALKRAQAVALARAIDITSAPSCAPRRKAIALRRDETLVEYADGDYAEELSRRLVELEAALLEISRVIYSVKDGVLREVLINRYILFRTPEETAAKMNYSLRHTMRLQEMAICSVNDVIGRTCH